MENESPIRSFLSEYGIEVCPSKKEYIHNGVRHNIDDTALAIKLYSTDAEIEAFIAGDLETLKDYSCIEYNPEFLRELSALCGLSLQSAWEARKNSLIYVDFDVSFDECSNIQQMWVYCSPDNYERIIPHLSQKKKFGEESITVWRNFWFILACIENACPEVNIDRSPMAVSKDVDIGPDRIKVWC